VNKKLFEKSVEGARTAGDICRSERRTTALDKKYTKALEGTLTEWLSKKDEKVYRKL